MKSTICAITASALVAGSGVTKLHKANQYEQQVRNAGYELVTFTSNPEYPIDTSEPKIPLSQAQKKIDRCVSYGLGGLGLMALTPFVYAGTRKCIK